MNDINTAAETVEVAKLTRHEFGPSIYGIRADDASKSTGHFYSKLVVYTPEGLTAKVSPLPDEHKAEIAKYLETSAEEMGNAATFEFDRAIIFNTMHGQREVQLFEKLVLVVKDAAQHDERPDRNIDSAVLKLIDDDYAYDSESVEVTPALMMNTLAILAAVAGIDVREEAEAHLLDHAAKSKYGPDVTVMEQQDDEPFVLIGAATISGMVGTAAPKYDDAGTPTGTVLRVFEKVRVFFEPGYQPKRAELPEKDREAFREMSHGTFNPTHYLLFERSAMADEVGDGVNGPVGVGLALGNLKILVEDGTLVERNRGWVPRTPFTLPAINYTTFYAESDHEPSKAEMLAAENQIESVEVIGGTLN